jgi:hypothetical protein
MLAPVVADYVDGPLSILATNQIATMAANVFFMDRWRIKFITVEYLQTRMAASSTA